MDKQQSRQKFSPEVRTRAVRMVFEHRGDHASQLGSDHLDHGEDRLHGSGR